MASFALASGAVISASTRTDTSTAVRSASAVIKRTSRPAAHRWYQIVAAKPASPRSSLTGLSVQSASRGQYASREARLGRGHRRCRRRATQRCGPLTPSSEGRCHFWWIGRPGGERRIRVFTQRSGSNNRVLTWRDARGRIRGIRIPKQIGREDRQREVKDRNSKIWFRFLTDFHDFPLIRGYFGASAWSDFLRLAVRAGQSVTVGWR